MLRISLFAAELEIELLCIACTALLEQVTETGCGCSVEQVTGLFEGGKRIGIQHG